MKKPNITEQLFKNWDKQELNNYYWELKRVKKLTPTQAQALKAISKFSKII